MNADAKREYLLDLRSGKYLQANERLRKDDSYCCLGVLCETYRRVTGQGEWVNSISGHEFDDGFGHSEVGTPPRGVLEWAGIESDVVSLPKVIEIDEVDEVTEYDSLVSLNDEAGYDFNQIADVIEQQL